jgi:large subunit ribosomal protein L53
MITRYITGVRATFNPFVRKAKTARLFLSFLPANARQTVKIATTVLPRESREPNVLHLTFSMCFLFFPFFFCLSLQFFTLSLSFHSFGIFGFDPAFFFGIHLFIYRFFLSFLTFFLGSASSSFSFPVLFFLPQITALLLSHGGQIVFPSFSLVDQFFRPCFLVVEFFQILFLSLV